MTEPVWPPTKVMTERNKGLFPALDTRTLFVLLYAVALFVVAVRPTLDPDMWWHLRTGEYILEQGIPRHDVFSFTVADHRWITHEWLSQVFMWLLYAAGGFPALILTFAALVAFSFWLVYHNSSGRPYLAAFVGLVAAFASAPTWGARPQMFNILFLALFLHVVEGVRRGRFTVRAFWWLPLLSALWANLHSGYLLGVVLLTTYAVGDGAQIVLGRWLPGQERQLTLRHAGALALAAGGSLLAAALNPNTFELWVYPFETLRSPAMQQFIQEWHPPNFRLNIFWPFAALLLLGVVGWAYGRRPTVNGVLLFLGTAAAGLLSARHIPLFAVVAAPIVSQAWWQLCGRTELSHADENLRNTMRPPKLLILVNFILLAVVLLAAILWVGQMIARNEVAIAERFPVDAVDFLEARGLDEARGYNSYGWGGYMIWRGIPVYVDGRADVYGDDFLFFYQQAAQLRRDWREPLEQFSVDYVMIHRGSPLATMLAEVRGWREVYADEMARIFVRDD